MKAMAEEKFIFFRYIHRSTTLFKRKFGLSDGSKSSTHSQHGHLGAGKKKVNCAILCTFNILFNYKKHEYVCCIIMFWTTSQQNHPYPRICLKITHSDWMHSQNMNIYWSYVADATSLYCKQNIKVLLRYIAGTPERHKNELVRQ